MSKRHRAAPTPAGTGACAVDDVVALTRHAGELGVAAVRLMPPFYYKGVSDGGLFEFVAKVIERCGASMPRIMLYHIPPMAAVGWSHALIARLSGRNVRPSLTALAEDDRARLLTEEAIATLI